MEDQIKSYLKELGTLGVEYLLKSEAESLRLYSTTLGFVGGFVCGFSMCWWDTRNRLNSLEAAVEALKQGRPA